MKKALFFLSLPISLFFVSSCYYDNEETLYPKPVACDTADVRFSTTIAPILQANCNGCHSKASPSGNIVTDNYTDLKTIVDNGKLSGSINHKPQFSAMPKGGNKLSNCELAKFRIWIEKGALNN